MNLKAFYAALLSVLVTVIALSIIWEFWLEDQLMPLLGGDHRIEGPTERWEYVISSAFFSFIAMLGPAVIGALVIKRQQILTNEVIRLSQEDSLTGLYNRRHIQELLENDVQRANRYETQFAVIMTDIDHFKSVNDQFGHQVGDEVLTGISKTIQSSVRETDLVGRWGGEEFLIIVPATDIDGGFMLAEKIRTLLESTDLGDIGSKTASFGVTCFTDGDGIVDIIARADKGLYAAKQAGRNQIVKVPPGALADPPGTII